MGYQIATVIAAVIGLAGQTAPSQPNGRVSVPMTIESGRPIVTLLLDGDPTPLRFIVDTAAGGTVLDTEVANRRGLAKAGGPTTTITGASGESAPQQVVPVGRLTVGGFTVTGLTASLTSMAPFGGNPRFDGILGNDFLRRYAVLFDVHGKRMVLQDADRVSGLGQVSCVTNVIAKTRTDLAGFAAADVSVRGEGLRLRE